MQSGFKKHLKMHRNAAWPIRRCQMRHVSQCSQVAQEVTVDGSQSKDGDMFETCGNPSIGKVR